MCAWENADFRPEARNRKKNRRKIDFGLTRKIGKKSPQNRKPIFEPFFLFLGDFFPIFQVRPKSIFRRFFSDFGPESRNGHSPRHTYSQSKVYIPSRELCCVERSHGKPRRIQRGMAFPGARTLRSLRTASHTKSPDVRIPSRRPPQTSDDFCSSQTRSF